MSDYLYTSMSGALHTMKAQSIHANNLSNSGTTGFRRDFESAMGHEVKGAGHKTTVLSQTQVPITDFTPGALDVTGRNLDVGIKGSGFFAVTDDNGNEAYTRVGNLQLDAEGRLSSQGREVVGNGGAINVPEHQSLHIGSSGSISITAPGGGQLEAGQLKLVNPDPATLTKGTDGLFRPRNGGQVAQDDNVVVLSRHLEGSNVNPVDEMVSTMSLSRTFEIQVRMMKTADENAAAGSRLVRGS
jgi:flagellar basal-body rod protein FlgF